MESLNWKVETKNKLYFNNFNYKAKIRIVGACYTYYTNDIETYIQRIEKWRDESKKNLYSRVKDYENRYWDSIDISTIEKFFLWRIGHSDKKCITRIQGDCVSVFSNDIDIIKSTAYISDEVEYYKVSLTTSDTIQLKNKKHYNYRTYFKGKRVTGDFMDNFNEFTKIYKSNVVSISPALIKYMQRQWTPYMYMHSSYFIDYTDESFLSILYMHFPNMISKTYKLEEAQKN